MQILQFKFFLIFILTISCLIESYINKFPVKVTYKLNKKSFTHYKNSPFTIPSNFEFKPSLSEKITFDKFTDLRQGIYECCVDFQKSKIK